ncbi:nitric oxide synthase oxygenase [Saccharopolyspora sp. CA-218241]|uniref:nitric oxide synthase oxygenase n=1 Tax=Saccharopolyspora sp. CA-218241 TaxID=3240027 RepID=UPI003D987EB1
MAWRNSARCVGRLYWRSLKVRDLRDVRSVAGVAAHCVQHLRLAGNGGKVRPVISVFPPETPQRPAPRIWNEQLIRYAGYEAPDGSVRGDPRYRRFTSAVLGFGWRPPARRTPFDVLPLVVETAEEGSHMFALPPSAVLTVPMSHPELPWFRELGLRWHAASVISHMRISIGGVSYPAAPPPVLERYRSAAFSRGRPDAVYGRSIKKGARSEKTAEVPPPAPPRRSF